MSRAHEIPISLGPDNYAHLSVRVNGGEPLDFIFDTGANTCVLTERGRAKLSKLKFDSFQETLGSGGVTRQPVARGIKFSLGTLDWSNETLMLIDYHGSLHADGVIGYNLFAKKTISLEFDRGVLTVYDRIPDSAKRGTPLSVTMKDDLAFIPVSLTVGTVSHTDLFAVDTGYGGAVTIAAPLAQLSHLPGRLETLGIGKSGGTGSETMEVAAVKLPELSLGGQTLTNVPADIQLDGRTTFKTWNILGNEVVKRFNLVWDIRGKKMYLLRNRNFRAPYPLVPGKRPVVKFIMLALAALLTIGAIGVALWKRRKALSD